MKSWFYKLAINAITCFKGRNLIWHFAAIAITYIIVVSNTDWLYYSATRNPTLNAIFFPAIIFGGILPIIVPLAMLIFGKFKKNAQTINIAWALAQAEILGLLVSDFYKAITGRAHPYFGEITENITRDFDFGFLKKGVFWGWPSSHTAVAFSAAIALWMLFPKIKKIKYPALIYAIYIGLGVSISIHWLSDFIAGAILGILIGKIVGKSFQKSTQNTPTQTP